MDAYTPVTCYLGQSIKFMDANTLVTLYPCFSIILMDAYTYVTRYPCVSIMFLLLSLQLVVVDHQQHQARLLRKARRVVHHEHELYLLYEYLGYWVFYFNFCI